MTRGTFKWATVPALAALGLLLTPLHAAEDAATVYKRQCAGCHGANGSGQTTMGKTFKLKDLRSAEVQNMSDDQLFDVIAKGKGKMPAYENNLGHDNIHALVKYLRGLAKESK